MINLAFSVLPLSDSGPDGNDQSLLGSVVLWVRRQARYHGALRELDRLDGRDLADLDLDPAEFRELAWRYATGAAPLAPSERRSRAAFLSL